MARPIIIIIIIIVSFSYTKTWWLSIAPGWSDAGLTRESGVFLVLFSLGTSDNDGQLLWLLFSSG
jgi:hypothetical protein